MPLFFYSEPMRGRVNTLRLFWTLSLSLLCNLPVFCPSVLPGVCHVMGQIVCRINSSRVGQKQFWYFHRIEDNDKKKMTGIILFSALMDWKCSWSGWPEMFISSVILGAVCHYIVDMTAYYLCCESPEILKLWNRCGQMCPLSCVSQWSDIQINILDINAKGNNWEQSWRDDIFKAVFVSVM